MELLLIVAKFNFCLQASNHIQDGIYGSADTSFLEQSSAKKSANPSQQSINRIEKNVHEVQHWPSRPGDSNGAGLHHGVFGGLAGDSDSASVHHGVFGGPVGDRDGTSVHHGVFGGPNGASLMAPTGSKSKLGHQEFQSSFGNLDV